MDNLEIDLAASTVTMDNAPDDAAERVAMLEFDIPAASEPVWLARLRVDMARAKTRGELTALATPIKLRPEAERALARPLYNEHWARLAPFSGAKASAKARSALGQQAPQVAPAAPTVESPTVAPIQPQVVAEDSVEPATGATGTLESELASIGVESGANAATVGIGSMAGGQMRGVGFSSAEGYTRAIQNGVPAHTHASYLSTLRSTYGWAQETCDLFAAQHPPMAEDMRPVGQGITHVPTGPSTLKVGNKAKEVKSGTVLLRAGDLIAGAIAGGAGGDFSWAGAGTITRAQLLEVLAEIGRESDAPAAKNAHAQAGRAVAELRSLGYHIHAVQGLERKTLSKGVAHRYIVGRALAEDTSTVAIGSEYGRRVLVVDLWEDDTLHCEGQADLAAQVQASFEARCAEDIYVSADLTAWLQRILRNVHGGTRFGVGWYVPAGQRDAMERLTRTVSKVWGTSWRHGMPVAACSHLVEGLTEGLSDEVLKIEEEWRLLKVKATEAHKLQVGTRGAAGVFGRLAELADRIRGYAMLLGDEAVAGIRARIIKLNAEVEPLTDNTSARAEMLEFS